jgi:antitoxin of RelE/RelB toxin-antitoxin system
MSGCLSSAALISIRALAYLDAWSRAGFSVVIVDARQDPISTELYNWYYLTNMTETPTLSSMAQITYSRARADLANLYDRALEHLPTRIERRRADPAVLLSLEDFKALLGHFEFAPEVLFEASSVAVWLPELAIWGRGTTFAEAKEDLLEEIDQLLALVAQDARLRSAPNMVERLPWIFRLMYAESDAEREEVLFAAPAAVSRPVAVAGA